MSQRPSRKRPLPIVLLDLAGLKRDLVLIRGQHAFRIENIAEFARRQAISGSPAIRRYLSAFNFWWEEDPDGKVVVMVDTPEGPQPLAAEYGSRFTALALDNEGEWGREMMLSGSMRRRKSTGDPQYRDLREGFWRMIQRIHHGIPGYNGTGIVQDGQFTGGNAGIRTAWVVKPYSTSSMVDAVAIAGFYAFGRHWAEMLRLAGLSGNFSNTLVALNNEFGIASDQDLERGTVPNPKGGSSMGKPVEAKVADMVKGPQFETNNDGTHFIVSYTKHFVLRYTHDEGRRPAVSRFMDAEMVKEEIQKALPQVREMLQADPYAEGIIISQPYGLSMKFVAVPIDDGWQLNFVTQIIALPLWRTSDREVEIVVNPVVDVRFDDQVPEALQVALLADLAPRFMELGPGEEETLSGELVSAVIRHGVEGFSVSDVTWKDAWEPLYV